MSKSRIAIAAIFCLFASGLTAQAGGTFGLFTQAHLHPHKSWLIMRPYNAFTPVCYSGIPVQWPATDDCGNGGCGSRFSLFGHKWLGGCGISSGCGSCGQSTGCGSCGSDYYIPGADGHEEVIKESAPVMQYKGLFSK